jgi:hypothetical protein
MAQLELRRTIHTLEQALAPPAKPGEAVGVEDRMRSLLARMQQQRR